jgi:hypothetical protein
MFARLPSCKGTLRQVAGDLVDGRGGWKSGGRPEFILRASSCTSLTRPLSPAGLLHLAQIAVITVPAGS